MPTPPEHPQQRLQELSATPVRLSDIFEDMSNYERVWRPAPNKWSCIEVAGHLVDVELVFGFRIRTALAEPGKQLDSFDQNKWVSVQRWNDLPAESAIRTFSALRAANITLLELLGRDEWSQEFVHIEHGPQTIVDIVNRLLTHDARHLMQLGRTAEEARSAFLRGTGGIPR